MSSTNAVDPFATKDLLELPPLSDDTSQSWSGFRLERGLEPELFALAKLDQSLLSGFHPEILKLAIDDAPSLDIESPTRSSATESTADHEGQQDQQITHKKEVQDCWDFSDLDDTKRDNKLVSWDHFVEPEYEEATQTFITEAGPVAFDALLCKLLPRSHSNQTKHVKPNFLINALFDLGLGRSSAVFQWSEQNQRFTETVQDYTMSGLSKGALHYLVVRYLDAGAQFRRLSRFGRSRANASPTRIALQKSMLSILHVVEEVIETSRHDVHSLIQLQDVYHRSFVLLGLLDRLLQSVASILDDGHLVTAVVAFAEQVAMEQPYFEHITSTITAQVLQPSLKHVEASIGLITEGSGVTVYQNNIVCAVLPDSTSKIFKEATVTLQILQENAPDTLILRQRSYSHKFLGIDCSLDAMVPLQQKANDHEQLLRDLLVSRATSARTSDTIPADSQPLPTLDADAIDPFCLNTNLFETNTKQPIAGYKTNDYSIQHCTKVALASRSGALQEIIVPCREAIDLSLRPFLIAQHRLLSYSVFQILFQQHDFLSHVNLLSRFQLLNDGIFVSKLSTALFDSDQNSGESKRKPYAKTGLRLQNRKTWPPASSELRLVLTSVLTECMTDVNDSTLTDTISFAIRDLSDEDLERCRDIDSIYALDFLRLNYKPPPSSVVETILTQPSLEKYDQIFNHLLRILRMKTLTQSLIVRHDHDHDHDHGHLQHSTSKNSILTHRFAVESHNLITSLVSHSQLNVIQPIYSSLTNQLQRISTSLSKNDYTNTLTLANGLETLRRLHELTLDKILQGLLLSRSELRGIVERIFEVILRFAAEISLGDGDNELEKEGKIQRLYRDFRIHVKKLLELIKKEVVGGGGGSGSGTETGSDGGKRTDESNVYERLLIVVDWNGCWSRDEKGNRFN